MLWCSFGKYEFEFGLCHFPILLKSDGPILNSLPQNEKNKMFFTPACHVRGSVENTIWCLNILDLESQNDDLLFDSFVLNSLITLKKMCHDLLSYCWLLVYSGWFISLNKMEWIFLAKRIKGLYSWELIQIPTNIVLFKEYLSII